MEKVNSIQKITEIVGTFEDTKLVLQEQVKKWKNIEVSRDNKKQVAEAERDHREKRYALQNAETDIKKHLNATKKEVSDNVKEMIGIIEPEENRFKEFRLKLDAEDLAEKQRVQRIEQDRIDKIKQTIQDFESDSMNFINECKTSDEVTQAVINLPSFDFQEFKAESIEALERIKEYRVKAKYDLLSKEKAAKEKAELEKKNAEIEKQNKELAEKLAKFEAMEKAKAENLEIKTKFNSNTKDLENAEIISATVNGEELNLKDYEEVTPEPVELPKPSEKSISEVMQNKKIEVVTGSITLSYTENGLMKTLSITTIHGKLKAFLEQYITDSREVL